MTKEETVVENSTSTTKIRGKDGSIDDIRDLISNLSITKNEPIESNGAIMRNIPDSLDNSKNEHDDENAGNLNQQLDICTISNCENLDDNGDSDNSFDKTTFSLDEEDSDQHLNLKLENNPVVEEEGCSSKEKLMYKTSNQDPAKTTADSDSESDDEATDKSNHSSVDSDSSTDTGEGFKETEKCATAEASQFKDEDSLNSKLLQLYIQDESEDEEKEEFVTRGPLTDNKNHSSRYNRFSPLHPYPMIPGDNSHGFNHHRASVSPIHENNSSASMFDSNYRQFSTGENLSQGFGLSQPFNSFGNADMYASSSQLSPESIHSNSSPFYSSSFSLSANPNTYGYQTELQSDDWLQSVTQSPQSVTQSPNMPNFDIGSTGFESYQPLSPPQSVSPPKDANDGNNNYGGSAFCETEDLKEEDLINVINSVNRTSKTEPKGIPETQTELSILQNVLEGNEYSTRDEMGMYLKNEDACFQPSFIKDVGDFSILDSASQFSFSYEPPLTPPKSVSPVSPFQDGTAEYGYSPSAGLGNNEDCQSLLYSEENLSFILDGIDEISRDEMNIYMGKENNASDPSYARKLIQARCKPNNLDHALRKLSSLSLKTLCEKDADGDTGLMIVYSSDENSHDFYENIFCLQERVREIRVCCDAPLGKGKRCKICGNADPAKFYTPLSFKNNVGDTALSCAVKKEHSQIIVDYLLHGILQCKEDFRRVFDENGRQMLMSISYNYPSLWKYVMYQPGPA